MLVTDKPAELRPQNDLDAIPADLLGPIPAEIRLGRTVLLVMEKPPEVKDVITVMMRLRVKDEGKGEAGEGGEDLVHYRLCKIVNAWLAGQPEPPDPNADQGELIDTDGKIVGEPETVGEIAAGINGDGVDRPGFSNLTGGNE